jgi:hypothetical protein
MGRFYLTKNVETQTFLITLQKLLGLEFIEVN